MKESSGPFGPGEQATYILTVTNVGGLPTTGESRVFDDTPAPLTLVPPVTGAHTGWNCDAASTPAKLDCTNPNTIAAGQSFTFNLTVLVSSSPPPSIENTAFVETDGECCENALGDGCEETQPCMTDDDCMDGNFPSCVGGDFNTSNNQDPDVVLIPLPPAPAPEVSGSGGDIARSCGSLWLE